MRAKLLAAAMVLGFGSLALATTPFPIVGGSYIGNMSYRLDGTGTNLAGVASTFQSGIVALGSNPEVVVNYSDSYWQIGHYGHNSTDFSDVSSSAGVVVKLDQVYTLNKIHLDTLPDWAQPSSYQVRVSPDNTSWAMLQSKTDWPGGIALPLGAKSVNLSFAATDVKYIEWTVWGTGQTADGSVMVGLANVLTYVASTAANVPQKEQGYNLAVGAAVLSKSGWQSWGDAGAAVDGNLWSDGANPASSPATAVYDLGAKYKIDRLRTSMYNTLTGATIEVSADNVSYAPPVFTGTLAGATTYLLSTPSLVQYIRVTVTGGGGHLREVQAFAFIPEPATLSLLALAGMGLLARRRR